MNHKYGMFIITPCTPESAIPAASMAAAGVLKQWPATQCGVWHASSGRKQLVADGKLASSCGGFGGNVQWGCMESALVGAVGMYLLL